MAAPTPTQRIQTLEKEVTRLETTLKHQDELFDLKLDYFESRSAINRDDLQVLTQKLAAAESRIVVLEERCRQLEKSPIEPGIGLGNWLPLAFLSLPSVSVW
jgi:chromosome segregation ATPase